MNVIRKQKFLAELGKLLTFMYEEDRQTALSMYGKMFDDTEDEEALIQFLGSPTRQAVTVARAYDAKMRKLQVETQSRLEDSDAAQPQAAPDFVLAIDKLYQEFIPEHAEQSQVMADQFSLFAGSGHPVDDGMDAVFPVLEKQPEPAAEAPVRSVPHVVPPVAPAPEFPESERDAVDDFLESFAIREESYEAAQAEEEEAAASAAAEAQPAEAAAQEPSEPKRQPRVFLLILYILFAVPLTLLGIAILLLPTLLFLALAIAAIAAGAGTLVAAFGGFPVFADFLLVLGTSIVLLALGLLFLWIFVWFIGGVIAGLVAGVISLGRQWCYKEVVA